MTIEKLHFVTYDHELTHSELAEIALKGGARCIQVRVKGRSFSGWVKIAAQVREVCERYEATCIVNDSVAVAKSIGAHGVHLGVSDGSLEEARAELGTQAIIGASVSSPAHLDRITRDTDYLGVGPYRFTTTKTDLSPLFGSAGLTTLLEECQRRFPRIPTIAIGGITVQDIPELLSLGVHGVAVASAIGGARDREKAANQFVRALNETH